MQSSSLVSRSFGIFPLPPSPIPFRSDSGTIMPILWGRSEPEVLTGVTEDLGRPLQPDQLEGYFSGEVNISLDGTGVEDIFFIRGVDFSALQQDLCPPRTLWALISL